MALFHKHNWIRIATTYVPPRTGSSMQCSEYLAERLFAGLTIIMWECSKCKKIRKEEMLGSLTRKE